MKKLSILLLILLVTGCTIINKLLIIDVSEECKFNKIGMYSEKVVITYCLDNIELEKINGDTISLKQALGDQLITLDDLKESLKKKENKYIAENYQIVECYNKFIISKLDVDKEYLCNNN